MTELPPECLNYQELSESTRNASFNDPMVKSCDNAVGDNWYRFTGAAGTQMPTTAPPIYSCGTDAPGWLNGAYPEIDDGAVSRQVCFAWLFAEQCKWSTNVQIRKCDVEPPYYVFKLPNTPQCNLRYCGAD